MTTSDLTICDFRCKIENPIIIIVILPFDRKKIELWPKTESLVDVSLQSHHDLCRRMEREHNGAWASGSPVTKMIGAGECEWVMGVSSHQDDLHRTMDNGACQASESPVTP